MDLITILKLLPTLVSAGRAISDLIAKATSNEDIITKIGELFPAVSNLLKTYGEKLFPSVNENLQSAAAAIDIFGKEFVKTAQVTLNLAMPVLGITLPQLVVDGITGPRTREATRQVQEKLASLEGFKDLVIDGFFGFKTKEAIGKFFASFSGAINVQKPE